MTEPIDIDLSIPRLVNSVQLARMFNHDRRWIRETLKDRCPYVPLGEERLYYMRDVDEFLRKRRITPEDEGEGSQPLD